MHTKLPCALVLLIALSAASLGAIDSPSAPRPLDGITKPSADVTLSFVRPGRVKEVFVKEGDTVKAGDPIAQQDDVEEQEQLKADLDEAEDDTEINAEMEVFTQDKRHLEELNNTRGASAFERDDADIKVKLDQARIILAKHKKRTAGFKVGVTRAVIEKLTIKSPIDGIVAESMLKAGEAADGQNMKVVRIVQIQPLWVEVSVPILQARKLKTGDVAQVTFTDKSVRSAKVALVFPVGSSGSSTIKVRLTLDNPEKLQPGENVTVKFATENVAAARPQP
jgi:RND family efflux transporter MFP subunit